MKDEYDFSNGVRGAVVDSAGKTRISPVGYAARTLKTNMPQQWTKLLV